MADKADTLNATHAPTLRSWVASAHEGNDFPIQNLPFGRFRRKGETPRGGVVIGDSIVDLRAVLEGDVLEGEALIAARAAAGEDLRPLLKLGSGPASALRAALSRLLAVGGPSSLCDARERVLVTQDQVEMLLPTEVRQFSDMCASTFHIGRFNGVDDRSEPICPPMFRTIPVGYDGRASSVVIPGTPVRRPNGTWQKTPGDSAPQFGPEPRQDYELEVGLWFGGAANTLGCPLTMSEARAGIFGISLLNDWSARGIQFWETMLGPFLGKSLATTVSPWIVTREALTPFRTRAFSRPPGDPTTPKHLFDVFDQNEGGYDIELTATLQTAAMHEENASAQEICRTNFKHMYWTFAQMLTHHASNGCGLAAGDLIGSGTCSGPAESQAACLAETANLGPIKLQNGETRYCLEDGDRISLHGRATREGFVSIGFGRADGEILPALDIAT